MLVVVAESVELHVGRLMAESVVHVNVTAPEVIAKFLILPPDALLPFNVIVFVFGVQSFAASWFDAVVVFGV